VVAIGGKEVPTQDNERLGKRGGKGRNHAQSEEKGKRNYSLFDYITERTRGTNDLSVMEEV